jgi:hypothetical protein
MLAYIQPVVVKLAERVPDLNGEDEALLSRPRAKGFGSARVLGAVRGQVVAQVAAPPEC